MPLPANAEATVEALAPIMGTLLAEAEAIGARGEATARGGELRTHAQEAYRGLAAAEALFAAFGDAEADAVAEDLAEARDFVELVAAAADSPVSITAAAWDRGARTAQIAWGRANAAVQL